MADEGLDETDRRILHALRVHGSRATNAALADLVGRSPSTVGKRIKRLEDEGVITNAGPGVDYERAGYPLHVLFVCSAAIESRSDLAVAALDVPGVVNVLELMLGADNLHVEAVARSTDDLTETAQRLRALGLGVGDETLIRSNRSGGTGVFDDAFER